MATIEFKYGLGSVPLEYDAANFDVLSNQAASRPLADYEIGAALDEPIGTPALEDIVKPGESVLFVVPDATREVGCGQVVNLLIRRLIAAGVAAFDIRIIFATGIHRKTTADEKAAIVTPFVAQRIKMLDHDPRDLMQISRVGETTGGITVELNRALFEHDHVVLIGGVSFHYFAGFTGGRKLICPGLASSRTITATHKLAIDCVEKVRAAGVGPSLLDGNPVHLAFAEAAAMASPAFSVTTRVNASGEITEIFCGDWQAAHRSAADAHARENTVTISEKRPLVIASCGGAPHDIDLIQAHKALNAAAAACTPGGTIVFLAECADGLGRADFLQWFEARDSNALAEKLCGKYQVNGQTAWNLLTIAERFSVVMVSSLPDEVVSKMRLSPAPSLNTALAGRSGPGYIIPSGASLLIRTQ